MGFLDINKGKLHQTSFFIVVTLTIAFHKQLVVYRIRQKGTGNRKKVVVKFYNLLMTPVICRKICRIWWKHKRIFLEIDKVQELFRLASPPTVYGLFGIAHQKQGT